MMEERNGPDVRARNVFLAVKRMEVVWVAVSAKSREAVFPNHVFGPIMCKLLFDAS